MIILIIIVGILVIEVFFSSFTGKDYTPEKYNKLLVEYCNELNMIKVDYIGQTCSFLGCKDVQKAKCVGDNGEKLINYKDIEFCEITVKGDLLGC